MNDQTKAEQEAIEQEADDVIAAWIDQIQAAAEAADECPDCEGAGCSTCDGSPLTDEEVDEQLAEQLAEHLDNIQRAREWFEGYRHGLGLDLL